MKQVIIFGLIIFLSFAFTINVLAVVETPQPIQAQKGALEPAVTNVVEEDLIAEIEPIGAPPPPPPVPTLYMDEDILADTPDVGAKKSQAKGQTKSLDKGQTQRSRVANAVQGLLDAADRQGGVGEQVRAIAQNQNQRQERVEAALGEAKKRGGFMKFIIGPKYKQLEKARTELHAQNLELGQLRGLLDQVTGTTDEAAIAEQIAVLEQVKNEVAAEVGLELKGFSLFGWLNKILSGYK